MGFRSRVKGNGMADSSLDGLAQRVVKLRVAAGLSQQALAQKAGLSISIVSQIEQGKRSDPRASTILALAKALGVECNDLISTPTANLANQIPTAPPTRRTARKMIRPKKGDAKS